MHLRVRVIPRARRSTVDGLRGDAVLVRLAAAPVDGRANQALVEIIAAWADVPRSSVSIVSGLTGRDKVVAIRGRQPSALASLVEALGG
ncbi:MAG: DUF167 domain-containing protein [Vicinamibacterales bacterium]